MIFHQYWRNFVREGCEGWIKVTPEDSDDIWCLYNVIAPGDEVEAVTMRYQHTLIFVFIVLGELF